MLDDVGTGPEARADPPVPDDYPGESAQVLAIAVIAPEEAFEGVLEEATPIVESLEIVTD